MSKRLRFVAATALALCIGVPAYAEDAPNAETVVATVNGMDITLGQMILARATLPQQYAQLPDEVLFDGILNQLVQQSLLADTMTELPQRVVIELENQKRQALAAAAIDAMTRDGLSEDAIKAAYDAKYAEMEPKPEWNASHILVEAEDEAKALVARARDGEDFAQLARDNSTGPSGPNGGELGWFGEGMMVPAFEDAVKGLEKGAVSDPVKTQFGWHVVKLNDLREKGAPDLSEVRAEVEMEAQQRLVDEKLQELTSEATIDRTAADGIDKSLLSDTSLLGS